MKLHLPKSLRTALLACLAALVPVAVTLATGAISVGAVVFSLGAQAQAETISITADTNWNATTNHSADTTTVSGATLKVGNGSGAAGSVAANGTVNLGNLTLTDSSTMNLWAWTTTDKDVSTDGKVNIAGELTLNNSNIWVEDGSYYFSAPINVVGSSVITSKWAKGIVIGTFNGGDDASLTLRSQGTDPTGALFTLGDGTEGESSFRGTLILDNAAAAEAKTTTLALNDSVALKDAALELKNFTNVIIMLDRVLVEALYGSGDVAHSYNNATGYASPVVQITGNATDDQTFSGTMASNVTWQIGDGTNAASSRFAGATLNGTLDIKAGSTAYLTGSNTFGSLTNNGTLYLNEGSSFSLSSVTVTEGATITVGSVIGDGLVNNAFAYGNGWTATYDGTGTATLRDTAVYWIDGGTDDNIAWSDGSNWSSGSVPASTDGVRLTADNAGKEISVSGNVTVKELRVYGSYTLNVRGTFSSVDGYNLYDGGSITKTGSGTLNATLADAPSIIVNEGTLKITERLDGDAESNDNAGAITYEADFTSLNVGANGTLAINAAEKANNNRTTVKLADSFAGTLEIVSGYVDTDSAFSGATIKVNGGGLLSRVPAGDIANNVIIGANGATFYSLGKTGVDETWKTKFTGAFSGSGTLTIQERGDWYFAGDMSGFTGSIVLNTSYDHVFFYSSASVSSFSASARLGTNSTVYFGDGTNAMEFVVDKAMTVSEDTHFAIASGASFKNKNQVTISGGKTLKLTGSGAYNMDGWLNMGSGAKLDVQNTVVVSLANTTQTINAGEIAIATDAVVSDSRVLTLDGNLSITGAGTYKQLGSLTISDGTTLTLSGKVTLTQLDNNGVITLADSLSSLTLVGFSDQTNINGRTYEIGTVTDGADKDWNALLGVTSTPISYDATTGLLTAGEAADLVWADLTGDTENSWNEASNWLDANGNAASVPYTTSKVVLGAGTAEGYDNTVTLTGNVEIASLTVQSNHNISVAADDSATLTAAAITLENGATLSKTGTGQLSMSLANATAAGVSVEEGTLLINDSSMGSANLSSLTVADGATVSVSLSGGKTDASNRGSVTLGENFGGVLAVREGSLNVSGSTLRDATLLLNGGGILVTNEAGADEAQWVQLDNDVVIGNAGAYVTTWGSSSVLRTTKLTGDLSGTGTLTKRDGGVLRLAGTMSGFAGSINVEGGSLYFENTDAANIGTLTLAGGTGLTLDNNATLTATTTATNGAVTVGATEGATFNMGAVSIAANATLKLEGAGTHTLSTLAMGNGATLELAAGTNAGITESAHHTIGNGNAVSIKLGEGATLTDAGSWQLTGSTMTVQGGGEYKLNSLVLSANQANTTTVNVESGTTLHITGTATNDSAKAASFGLGHWNADNAVNVRGVLELECGISSYSIYSNTATITVENGGKIAFNNGLHAAGKDHAGVININGGGVLEVSGTNVTGTNRVTVNVVQDGIVMGGNANDATESKIANNLNFGGEAYIGAKKDTTLTLAPEDGSTDMNWLVILGDGSEDGDTAGAKWSAGGMVAFDGALNVKNNVYIRKGGSMCIEGDITTPLVTNMGGLVFDGADTITLGQAIKNAGTVEVRNATDTRFVLSDALLQEVVGLSKTWTLVNNTGVEGLTGSITGWNALRLENFLLDRSTLQQGDWDGVRIADGKVMLYMLSRYWDATGAESVWNTGVDANWREFVDSTETVTFESDSRVTFTDTDENGALLDKSVTVADAGVQAKNVVIAGTDYVFSGGKVAVTHSMSIQKSAEFDSTLVIGSTSTPLSVDVWEGKTLTVGTLETSSSVSYGNTIYNNGAFLKTGEGTLLITDAINGTITEASISGGKLALGSGVNLAVGANTVTGGSLENVELLSSGTVTDYTGATAQALNVIKSADGVNYAVLTDVQLRAGAASSYATLQKVAFAGTSALSGYITFEETKQQRQMAVATGGTLTVSNLTFDLNGLSAGTKVLIENGAVADATDGFKGTLLGWNAQNVKLLYSGIAVNNAVVDMGTAGVVTLNTAETITSANMYWDGLVAGAAESDASVASSAWDKSSANWSASAGTNGSSAFLALSNTYFGATPEGGSKVVNATLDMVMSNMFVTEGGYSFTGSRLATLGNMSITPASGEVSFANELVVQGNVNLSAAQDGSVTLGGALQAGGTITATGEGALRFNSTVQSGGDITLTGNGVVTLAGNVSTAGNFSIGTEGAAVTDKADASTLYTIAGALTAKDILINIDASEHTAAADTGDHLVVSGNVSAMGDSATPAADGTITLLGSAAKKFTGCVTADTLRVNAAHGTFNNVITFTNVVDVNTLEIAEDTYVRIAHAGSDMDTVLLGGKLYMDSVGTTYANGYDVYSTSDAAELVFGTTSSNTINRISGLTPAEAGQYNSISVNANTRFLTVNALADLKDLTLYNGPMTVKAGEGAIHGNLVVRDAAGLSLTQNANNIMAEGSGSITVDHANMNLNSTTQTLRSGNDLYLAGGAITGNANGVGLNFVGTSSIYYTGNSTVSAKMTVAEGSALTVATGSALTVEAGKQMEDTLTLSGSISGTGSITMQGDGRVLLSGANTAYTGAVTVQQQTSLKLGHVDALAGATLNLAADGTVLVDRAAVGAPFNIGTLNTVAHAPVTLADGTTLTAGTIQIHSLQAMDAISAADSAFNVGRLLVSEDQVLNLTLSFAEGESLQTMKTYNLFTSSNSLSEVYEKLNVELYIAANHVDSSQYKLVYDATAKVIAIRTMLGNIWDGGADGDGIWSLANTDKNWTGKDYDESSAYNDAIFADLTGEGIGESAVVTINGTVNPGEIYFEADNTKYELLATEDGAMLAAGNVIHKAGEADVTLNLANNGTAENALGGMDLQAGATKLAADLAVAGEVSVAADATLQTGANTLRMVDGNAEAYTAQGTYSGLTMDATGIAGVAGAPGTVTNGLISGAAELNNLNLTGTGTLTGVTIGSGVKVATGAAYTLNGHITFLDTLQNTGTVTLDAAVTVEIGSLGYTFGVAATDEDGAQYGVSAGGSYYMYQLVQGGTINGMTDLTVDDVYINGVKLGGSNSGLAGGMAAVFTNNNGKLTLSIGAVTSGVDEELKVDGTVGMPSWDERWGKSKAEPALSRRYAGTDAAANISFAENDGYLYGAVVNAENAAKVNGGKAVVVTLSSAATGNRAAGGSSATKTDHEIWMYDRSGFDTVIAGQYADNAADYAQTADTHVLVNSTYDGADEDTTVDEKAWVVGGSWNVAQNANSYVTMQDGQVLTLVGGSVNSNQTGTSYVYIDGGRVFEVVGASYADAGKSVAHKAAEGETLASHLVITGGNLGGLASDGGTKSVYGGGIRANITGDIKVTVDGTATITNLVGGNYGGSITGNITMDLVSGTVNTVNAAGAGNASVAGNVSVYLSRDFDVSAGLFGGKQNNSGVTVSGTSTLYLTDAGEYVFAKWQGADAGTHDGFNQTLVAGSAVTIAGFDVVSLAQGAVLTVDTNHFDRNITNGTLVITGKGIVQMGGKAGARRDISLEKGATFKLLSSYTANNYDANGNKYAKYSKLYVTDGTTFDISGYPRENAANDGGGSIAYHVYLSGDGVDGMGALYKGATDKNNSTNPSGKTALGYIELTGNASATAEHNIDMIGPNNATTYLDLNGYTYTKRGEGAYVLRNTQINGGTYYAHEGTVQPEKTTTGADADLVLSDAATLKLNDNCNFTMRSLTGSGDTELGAFKLTLAPVSGGKYYAEFLDEANSYDNLMSGTGFAYGVYSGVITGSGSLYIGNKTSMSDRTGVQYLSGTDSTYSGGTHVEAGRLYLLSSTQGSISKGSSSVTSGPIGTGALYWDSSTAEVYLGHGVTVYNSGGTNAAGSDLILGVEGAPDGDLLKNYPGVNGTVVKDGVTYYEVDTHNLQSISCDGVYADGTAYVAGTEIDRNKMLLVTEAAWNSESSTVKGFTDTGYNEATYSGVLSGAAALVKVGAGTLVIDQANAYTGGTRIQAGTLKLKGWAQIGAAADGTIDVTQTAGSTLMLAYDGTYGDELTSISNNMVLTGTGDARWEGSDETGGGTAALISDVGSGVTFTLSGDISGDGNLLHSGEGTLVLSGDSSYTGGMHATRGVVEVQSATGLGAGVVTVDSASDLHVTVEDGTTASRLATTIKAPGSSVKGDVVINGTETTERILNIAVPTNKDKSQGYTAPTTTVGDNGTLLLNGDGINAETALLTGSGTLAVSDATGNGASANVGQMTDYTGDLHVEGNNASIVVENGNYSGGSISVSGNGANVSTKGDVTIVSGESLSLTSKGNAGETDTSAAVRTTGAVNVTNGATLSVAAAETRYEYNLQNLQASASLNTGSDLESGAENQAYTAMGTSAEEVYNGFFNTSVAMNQKAAGSVDAEDGLTLSGGASYETSMANTSLMGGTLTLDTTTTSLLNFDTTLDAGVAAIDGSGRTTQLVLFSDVGGVNFVLDNRVAGANSGIYYTRADRYISGCGYVDEETWLVYDSGAGVVYLDGIIPEPTTATLSLLALAALAARRRRK